MMKPLTMSKIAEHLGLSKATVSRAINNSSGVASDTKERIIRFAEDNGYKIKEKNVQVAIILPTLPGSFWKTYSVALVEAGRKHQLNCRTFLFSKLDDEEDALRCIDCAVKSEAKVIIIAAPNSERVKKTLSKLSEEKLVIQIEEYVKIRGGVFVGENSYINGRALAEAYFKKYPDKKNIVFFTRDDDEMQKRIGGFVSVMSEKNIKPLAIENNPSGTKTKAAAIARILEKYGNVLDCVVCTASAISDIYLAIKKLGLKRDVICAGFEYSGFDRKDKKIPIMASSQDAVGQSQVAIELAARYLMSGERPDKDVFYVENKFLNFY